MKLDFVPSDTALIIRATDASSYDCYAWEIHEKVTENSIDEIYTRSIFQRLTFAEVDLTLKSWLKVLKPGSQLEIILPNAKFYINQFLDSNRKYKKAANNQTLENLALAGLCGEQANELNNLWNVYKSLYDQELLIDILADHGFIGIKALKDSPQNLHLVAYKPTDSEAENAKIYERAELAYQTSHLGGHGGKTHLDEGILQYIISNYQVKSMVDIGCGPGGMLKLAKQMGLDVVGVDGDEDVQQYDSSIVIHDLSKGAVESLKDRHFDLAWSVEFLEHVEEQYMVNYMPLFAQADIVVCTAAPPGSGGYHHVNEQPLEYWVDAFKKYGFVYREDLTEKAKSHSTMGRDFFLRSGMVFTKVEVE